MNTKSMVVYVVFLALAAGDILLLCRRLEAKVQAGTMTRSAAGKQRAYQWRLFVLVVVICVIGGTGSLLNLL
jgi:hypothetical protein